MYSGVDKMRAVTIGYSSKMDACCGICGVCACMVVCTVCMHSMSICLKLVYVVQFMVWVYVVCVPCLHVCMWGRV